MNDHAKQVGAPGQVWVPNAAPYLQHLASFVVALGRPGCTMEPLARSRTEAGAS